MEASASLISPAVSTKEAEATECSFPRLRRRRRRVDDARLDLWGFATPSPPPPPMPPPPVSPSPSLTLAQPVRRPRGRPRSNPLPERTLQGKGKTSGAEGDTPSRKKRRRCRNKKYQTGEYITEKDKLEDGEHLEESNSLIKDTGVPEGRDQLKVILVRRFKKEKDSHITVLKENDLRINEVQHLNTAAVEYFLCSPKLTK